MLNRLGHSETHRFAFGLETAGNKRDEKFLRGIRGFDLFARDARFHSSCRRQYQRSSTHWRSASEENKRGHEDLKESRRTAFTKVCGVKIT